MCTDHGRGLDQVLLPEKWKYRDLIIFDQRSRRPAHAPSERALSIHLPLNIMHIDCRRQ